MVAVRLRTIFRIVITQSRPPTLHCSTPHGAQRRLARLAPPSKPARQPSAEGAKSPDHRAPLIAIAGEIRAL